MRTWWLVEELLAAWEADFAARQGPPNPQVLDQIGVRHGALSLGP